MRIDNKKESVRQSMSWLHTWSSLILGWLLYAIFVTGTLSFFQNEISIWMKPELHQSLNNHNPVQQTELALNYLQEHAPNAAAWTINLPNDRQTTLELSWPKQGSGGENRRGGERRTLDAVTGEEIHARKTQGGSFLYRFHFELYAMPRTWARWIVGIATMFMLVAIISGIITHKKIFKDFFTFRPKKGQRSWLDAHNATAVIALPFHIMITFSGLLLLMYMLMPWGITAAYQQNRDGFIADLRSQGKPPQAAVRNEDRQRNRSREHRKSDQSSQPLAFTQIEDITPFIQKARQEFEDIPLSSMTIKNPNTKRAEIELRAAYSQSLLKRGSAETVSFNLSSGKVIEPEYRATTVAREVYSVLTTLHVGRGAESLLRWLLFLSGILGTIMIATGLILWVVKRLPERKKLGSTPFGHRCVEVTNIAAIAGLPLAIGCYFWINRLLPLQLETRTLWEIRCFFIVWLLSFIHAAFRPTRQAWLEQLFITTLLFILIPILNPLTGGRGLWSSIYHEQWTVASFDLMSLALAVVFLICFIKVKNKPAPISKQQVQGGTCL